MSRAAGRARALPRLTSVREHGVLGLALLSCACSPIDVVAHSRSELPCTSDSCESPPGCRARACAPLASRATLCQGSGVLVQAGDGCSEDDAPSTSRFALCSCSDLVMNGNLDAAAFAGTLARPAPGAAAIGVNGELNLSGAGDVDGELRVVGTRNLSPDFTARAVTHVSTPPCRCAPERLLDISALVLAAKRENDNALAGVSEDALDGFSARQELTLECGRYFFKRLKGDAPLRIQARGNVAIFIESNIELNDSLSVQAGPGAQVSLFVAGDMRVGGALALSGDPNGRERVNLFLQSSGTVELRGSTEIIGQLYAPRAELVSVGTFQLHGSLFVRRAAPGGDVHLFYDTQSAQAAACEPLR